jgi:hypothetical protein
MSNGYARQSSSVIITGGVINASDFNNEFNALLSAFDNTTGHNHDSTIGGGAPISLTASVTGVLDETNGGTGLSSYTLGDVIYASATNTLAKLAGSTSTTKKYLSQTGDGTASAAPVWSQPVFTEISGTAAVTQGGTGQTSYTDGQLLIGNSTGNTLTKTTLTAGTGVTITNGSGAITISVTSSTYQPIDDDLTALAGLSTTGFIKRTGAGTASTVSSIDLTADVSGILPTANGGTANGFFTVSGPATSAKTYTFPNASATVLTDNAAITVAQGGTALTTYTLGDIIYSSAANTLAKLAGNTTTTKKFLQQTGTGAASAAPAWGQPAFTDITGTLAITAGGTGATTASAALTALGGAVSTRQIISGNGLTGGGDLSADCTLAVGAGSSIIVSADAVSVDTASQADMEARTSGKVATADNLWFHPGVAKATVGFVPGASPTPISGYNVASITRNGAGDYTLNFANAFASANYMPVFSVEATATVNCRNVQVVNGGRGTSTLRFQMQDPGGTPTDYNWVTVVVFGDF